MEKTIEQWYDMLPEPIRSEAMKARMDAIIRSGVWNAHETSSTLIEAIEIGFNWVRDGGSWEKWETIRSRATNGEFDPKPTASIDADAAIATITAMRERIAELEGKLAEINKLSAP